MKVLVTGSEGFIGQNLLPFLADAGNQVRCLDVRPRSFSIRSDHEFVNANIVEAGAMITHTQDIDTIVHLAALSGVQACVDDPIECYKNNLLGLQIVLEACRKNGVNRLVFASTCGAMFGASGNPPFDESQLPAPVSPYGASKLAGEALCHAYFATYGIETVILRFTNVYGPHMDQKSNAIPSFLRSAIHSKPVTVFGDGSQSRDFIFVSDVVHAIHLALTTGGIAGELFHIGTGRETTLRRLIQTIDLVSDRNSLEVETKPPRFGEVQRVAVNVEKAKSMLGFEAVNDLKQGLRKTLASMH